MTDFSVEITEYLGTLKRVIDSVDVSEVNMLMNLLLDALNAGSRIFIMGNGGSGSTASHYTGDFNKGLSFNKKNRFKFICLNDNLPTILAYANDVSYNDIFVEPLKNHFQKGDLVIGISGSGNSKNVLNAISWANNNGGITVGLSGYNGGKLKKAARYNVHINIDDMQITEDLHLVLDHCMMKIFYSYLQ